MSHPHSAPDEDAIAAEAATGFAQRDAGWTDDEAAAFARWRTADPRHEAAVQRLEATWTLLQQLGDYRPSGRTHPDRDLLAPPRRARFSVVSVAGIAAAAAVLLVSLWAGTGPLSPRVSPVAEAGQTFVTTPGGYQRLTLGDGSVVELNADTEVRVSYTASERHTTLVRGQAHFTVAKNQERPFRVNANGVGVRAVGTAFDVRLESTGGRVLVTAGTVELSRARAPATKPLAHAGWRALVPTLDASAPTVEPVSTEAMRAALAWHGSRLAFVEMPLREVVEQFNRRNTVQLALADAELGQMRSAEVSTPEIWGRSCACSRAMATSRSNAPRPIASCCARCASSLIRSLSGPSRR